MGYHIKKVKKIRLNLLNNYHDVISIQERLSKNDLDKSEERAKVFF